MSTAVSIFIPAYNAGRFLAEVVGRVPPDCWPEIQTVWIINDGSSDDTAKIADRLAQEHEKISAIHFPENRGYGAVVKEGLRRCRESGCACAICLHGDAQYPPEEISRFVRMVRDEKYDIVQGSRIASGTALSGGMPLYKFAANRFLTTLENFVYGVRLTDYHSGYLAYSRKALETIRFERLSESFDIDVELIAAARSLKLSIGEVSIPTRYAGEVSHLNPITYGVRVLRVMVRYLLGRYRR